VAITQNNKNSILNQLNKETNFSGKELERLWSIFKRVGSQNGLVNKQQFTQVCMFGVFLCWSVSLGCPDNGLIRFFFMHSFFGLFRFFLIWFEMFSCT
jgi:hypothetical protein